MLRFLKGVCVAALFAGPAGAEPLGLGQTVSEDEIAVWDIDVRPDGVGLPAGSGTVEQGDKIFAAKCAVCHGVFGEGAGRWPVLAGGQDSLTDSRPVKTIGSYWPYLSTVYDYVNRAMPFGEAQSLEADEVYAITAYLLYLNDEVDDEFELSSENFVQTRLPNEDAFKPDDRPETELAVFTGEPCMENCKDNVKITMRAAVLDVTPEETAAKAAEMVDIGVTAPETPQETVETPETGDPALIEAGEKVFKKCKACHQVGEGAKNRVGPILTGIVDGNAGAIDGFKYSKALQAASESGLVWTETELSAFLTKPKDYLKGTKMSFAGLRKEADVAAVIAYLKSTAP
ncbi:c-type cytochrome [Sulfitobacter sp. MF3-043]|uniref:c-type cytochrome n=1 Tax=Sulfitobacter sediminivivens TaxID=3252902 RepID=UPI0036DBE039